MNCLKSNISNAIPLLCLLLASSSVLACSAPAGGDEEDTTKQPNGESSPGEEGGGLALCDESSAGSPLLRRLTIREFESTLSAVFPELEGEWSSSLGADPISHFGFDNSASALFVGNQIARDLDKTAASVAAALVGALDTLLPCASAAADSACAGEFLGKYGKRLFRRPLTDPERETYLSFFEQASSKTDFASGVGWLTRALINSPQAVYRSEIGSLDDGSRKLSQHEIATELAYTYTGTTPSAELLEAADSGSLRPEKLRAEAEKLLATPLGRETLTRFFQSFLGYTQVVTVAKTNVSEFEDLRSQMKEETDRFVEKVVIEQGGGLTELLTSDVTYPSTALAEFYGIDAPSSDGEVTTRTEGLGVLVQGSVLSTEAGPDSSSPTQRGLLIFESFLCAEAPAVPPDIPEIQPPEQGVVTTRQRYEELHASGACASCHESFDPIGFGFEHFDEVGRYREDEGGLTIDPSGEIPLVDVTFSGQEELVTTLASLEEAQACVTSQLKAFSFGSEQACLGESQRRDFMSGDAGFVDYFTSFATEPHFTQRTEK